MQVSGFQITLKYILTCIILEEQSKIHSQLKIILAAISYTLKNLQVKIQ